MRQSANILVAIDIGTTKIAAIAGKKNVSGKIEILGLSQVLLKRVKRGVVFNIEEIVEAIQTVINDLQKRSGIRFSEVFVGLAGQQIKSMQKNCHINLDSCDTIVTHADMERLQSEIYKIPMDPGDEIIHSLSYNYIVDDETGIQNPVGMSGRKLGGTFHIFIGDHSITRAIEKCFDRVGINVKKMFLTSLASSDAVLTDDEKEAGVVLVDIGGGITDVAVYNDNIIRHTAVIPFGGDAVTEDIREGCSLLQQNAEQLKIQYGSALGDIAPDDKIAFIQSISELDPGEITFKSLAYIIQSRMEELIHAVNYEIQNSGYADKLVAGVVLTGGGAMLKHLSKLVKFKTALDVRIGLPNEHLARTAIDEINHPMYATGVGLLMDGFEYLETHKKSFNPDDNEEIVLSKDVVNNQNKQEEEAYIPPVQEKGKIPGTDKIKSMLSQMFDNDTDVEMYGGSVNEKTASEQKGNQVISDYENKESPNAIVRNSVQNFNKTTDEASAESKDNLSFGKDNSTTIKHLSDSLNSCIPYNFEQGKDSDFNDLVYNSVYAPERVIKNKSFFILAFIHTRQQKSDVKEIAHNFDESLIQKAIQYLDMHIKIGTRLTFKLVLNNILLEESVKNLVWLGDPSYVEFEVKIPESYSGNSVVGNVVICIDTVPVGVIKFRMCIEEGLKSKNEPAETKSIKYRNAFISYSSDDRDEVLKRVSMLPKLGVNYFCDLLTLKPGDRWSNEVYKYIEESDVFFLFWSSNAKRSEWVQKEWSHALEIKGIDDNKSPDIIPIVIEGPPPPEPPRELSHLHFNDSFIYFNNVGNTGLNKGNE
jgi:cell division protein FtsA